MGNVAPVRGLEVARKQKCVDCEVSFVRFFVFVRRLEMEFSFSLFVSCVDRGFFYIGHLYSKLSN